MRITICGSMYFAKEMLDTKNKLKKLGFTVELPELTEEFVDNPDLNSDFEFISNGNFMEGHFKKIADSDAILVLNSNKKGIDGYIGGSTLMEIGIAKFLNKKIFILNELPDEDLLNYIFEVKITNPIILNGDLNKITSSPSGEKS